jgi:hypothetical protein
MSALPPKADMCGAATDVRFGPEADTAAHLESSNGGNAYLGHLLANDPSLSLGRQSSWVA